MDFKFGTLEQILFYFQKYTHFYRIREEDGPGRPPPPPPPVHLRTDELRERNIDVLYIILKGIVWKFRFILNFLKFLLFRDLMSNFREMTSQWLQNGCPKKFQTFKI